jgi:diguanylate cyclase (GGDEF)-like protein
MGDELRLRSRMIGAGLWLSALLLGSVGLWIAFTWDRPHRAALAALAAAAAAATGAIALLPRERVVAGRWREPFFLTWSLSLIAFIAVSAGLDDGVRSPMVLMLFLTLVYAALSYPRWAVSVISGASLLAVVILGEVNAGRAGSGPTDFMYLAGLMLTLAVTGIMCICQARIQQQARTELQRVSRTDPLTGALNRLGFTERMEAELRRSAHAGTPLALLLLDFDDFKAVNDEHGHAAGDELLRWAVGAMSSALRPGDALGRLGGDEFAALLPATRWQDAGDAAARLQLALSLRVAASAGTAATDADGGEAETLHHCADQRLYAAKRARPVRPDPRVAVR